MCQQQQFDMSSQIEVLFENGMPRKLGKSVARTLKKRAVAAAAASAANNNNNNNDDCCTNCNECGGCLNPKKDFTKRCTCEDDVASASSSTDEEMSTQLVRSTSLSKDFSSTEEDSDESLVDSDTGFRPSSRKSSRRGCPMAAFLAKNKAIDTSTESQNQSPSSSSTTTTTTTQASSTVPVPATHTYQEDILAIFTQLTKRCLQKFTQISYTLQKSKTYRVLSKSTQPAHVIAVGILSFVLLAVYPNLLENEEAALNTNKRRSGWALVAYLGAFATHFGAQIWMTFVSGLSLYFALPRHTFGLCQQILFPKYFSMNSMLSILTLILFIKVIAGRWEFSSYVQVIALTVCAIIEVTVRLYFAPPLLRLMREKHKFEITVGSGQEVGQLEQGDLVKCPHYQGIHKAFRRIHMTVAMGNLTALVCTFLHLIYLAQKISV